ncbi:LOW QUALITY PROTEIN: uncharacterized protein LOC112600250 [Melanaphis sacchari]|uniref:LOW QUALITY PROTEIN: uncharacterized protein LOC112600250 n=1 Tax=Melanaphis sacchari TaxID=742174 RepID=UPI000DC14F9B|nr:LOW QUALITY PROTEIN: uncharacterized protein LOC112600250 [Melanaphis sacchari]
MSVDDLEIKIYGIINYYCSIKRNKLIKLIDDRRSLNQKIESKTVTKEELSEQIKAELNILDTFLQKIDQNIIETNLENINIRIVTILSNRINNMYKHMFLLFPLEKTSLSAYTEFHSNNILFITKCRNILDTIILRYHNDPEVYIIAATYAFDNRNDVDSARRYFAEGLKHHKNCKSLHIEEFWIEVQHLEKTAGASLLIAMGKYKNLIKQFEGDIEFHIILLDRAIKFKTIGELQCNIVRDMVKKYKHSELMWKKLAEINFSGIIYIQKTEQLHYDKNYINGIRSCIESYEEGLKKYLPLKNKNNLWNFYIDHIIEIRKSYLMKNEAIRNFINKTMERVFLEAHYDKALHKAEHYIYWAENVIEDRRRILKKAVQVIKDNVEHWIHLISYCLRNDDLNMANEVFETGIQVLKSQSMPLWEILISYLENNNPTLLQELYHKGSHFPFPEINIAIRLKYLEWNLVQYGIHLTRKLFSQLKKIKPQCKQLFTTMIKIEHTQNSKITKVKCIRTLYNDLCIDFGEKDIGIWLDYIHFENTYGSRYSVKVVYEASLVYLDPNLKISMKEEFKKLEKEEQL